MRYVLIVSGLIAIAGCARRNVETISIKGSDTEVNLVLQLAEAYMEIDPAVSINVTGGGSGVGIAGLLNDKIDVANSSRNLNGLELSMAAERHLAIEPFIFAADAIAIICNASVPVDSLSLEELGKIFSGETRTWPTGANSNVISLYGRQSNSGTFIYFREHVVGKDYASSLKQMNGNAQILEAVKADPNAIGYIGFGYLTDETGVVRSGIKVIRLTAEQGKPAVSPLDKAVVLTGQYPLTRPLFQYTNGEPAGKIRAFYEFEKSPAGRSIIAKNGYLPISDTNLALNSTK